MPSCTGVVANCIANPCMGRNAACIDGVCAIR
jgi:hypothetical protein